jgi:hypothetical protein
VAKPCRRYHPMATKPPKNLLRELLKKHFRPGTDNDAAAVMRTTSQMFAILDEHAPGEFSSNDVYQEMREQGFKEQLLAEELRWAVAPR